MVLRARLMCEFWRRMQHVDWIGPLTIHKTLSGYLIWSESPCRSCCGHLSCGRSIRRVVCDGIRSSAIARGRDYGHLRRCLAGDRHLRREYVIVKKCINGLMQRLHEGRFSTPHTELGVVGEVVIVGVAVTETALWNGHIYIDNALKVGIQK